MSLELFSSGTLVFVGISFQAVGIRQSQYELHIRTGILGFDHGEAARSEALARQVMPYANAP